MLFFFNNFKTILVGERIEWEKKAAENCRLEYRMRAHQQANKWFLPRRAYKYTHHS